MQAVEPTTAGVEGEGEPAHYKLVLRYTVGFSRLRQVIRSKSQLFVVVIMESSSHVRDELEPQHYETRVERMARKFKEFPFMPVGLAGLVAALGYGGYRFNRRGTMSPSIYLMQLRVVAQGTVVGCLALGLTYAMCKEYFDNHLARKPSE